MGDIYTAFSGTHFDNEDVLGILFSSSDKIAVACPYSNLTSLNFSIANKSMSLSLWDPEEMTAGITYYKYKENKQ